MAIKHTTSTDEPGTVPYARPGHRAIALGTLDTWKFLLDSEDERCRTNGFAAGVLSISYGPTSGLPHDAEARLAQALDVVLDHLAFTDRVCVLAPGELGVLMIPLAEVHDAELRAIAIDESLRSAGIDASIGWALRRPVGLFDAAARADAHAATAHGRHLRLVD